VQGHAHARGFAPGEVDAQHEFAHFQAADVPQFGDARAQNHAFERGVVFDVEHRAGVEGDLPEVGGRPGGDLPCVEKRPDVAHQSVHKLLGGHPVDAKRSASPCHLDEGLAAQTSGAGSGAIRELLRTSRYEMDRQL
jgi:hypothetical protein